MGYVNLIEFKNTCNTRHLGGYKTKDGKKTNSYNFIRSDSPFRMTSDEMDKLIDMGVTSIIDLRYQVELDSNINPFSFDKRVKYNSIPIVQGTTSNKFVTNEFLDMGDMYNYCFDVGQQAFKNIFTEIINTKGGVFFHCTIGKDRTGILACLILMLADVLEDEIIKDYVVSAKLLDKLYDEMGIRKDITGNKGKEIADMILDSKPSYIKSFMNRINKEHNGVKEWLKSLGFNKEEIDVIIKKTIDVNK